MGLDMYLYRQQYVSAYEWQRRQEEDEVSTFDTIVNALGVTPAAHSPHLTADVCVAYWRKANAVHKFFCDLDGGKDECQRIAVSVDKLIELRDMCAAVLQEPAIASSVLPTQSGFFFGSYGYDEWYMDDMRNTVEQLDQILSAIPKDADPWDYSFYYHASW